MKQLIKKWIFGSAVGPKKILFGAARGLKMKIDPLHKSQRILGLDEIEIQSSFKQFARRCPVLVDVGASDGYYALIYKKYQPGGYIYSCDADTNFRQDQEDNFKENGFDTKALHYISKFIGDRDDEQFARIDSIVDRKADSNIFLKIDIDGGELGALKGAENTLRNKNCFVIVETHSLELENKCLEYMKSLGYSCRIIKNGFIRNFVPEKRIVDHNRWFSATKAI